MGHINIIKGPETCYNLFKGIMVVCVCVIILMVIIWQQISIKCSWLFDVVPASHTLSFVIIVNRWVIIYYLW